MNNKKHLNVVKHYGLRFQQPDCYFATAGEVADWWRTRSGWLNGKPITKSEISKYHPVRLLVTTKGELERIPVKLM